MATVNEPLYPFHNHIRITPIAWESNPEKIVYYDWEIFLGPDCLESRSEKTEEEALRRARAAADDQALSELPVKYGPIGSWHGHFS